MGMGMLLEEQVHRTEEGTPGSAAPLCEALSGGRGEELGSALTEALGARQCA